MESDAEKMAAYTVGLLLGLPARGGLKANQVFNKMRHAASSAERQDFATF